MFTINDSIMRIAVLLLLISFYAFSQDKNPWNGKRCAVVLTYDDALNVHLDNVIPALDSLNMKGTFYLSGYFPGCRNRLSEWGRAGKRGHELGNHWLTSRMLQHQGNFPFVKVY